ncbi:hypothetical protein ABZ078_36950 [Streptomyces sp. NPDC006385]|uniref:hypothetical protein n=1 Tax=Streptomyces sp. NPDC006385 TaxID=3156761 RepID=UPI0033A3F57B
MNTPACYGASLLDAGIAADCPRHPDTDRPEKCGESGKGKWDAAAAPTASDWGGSFRGVPTAGGNVHACR